MRGGRLGPGASGDPPRGAVVADAYETDHMSLRTLPGFNGLIAPRILVFLEAFLKFLLLVELAIEEAQHRFRSLRVGAGKRF